MPANTPEAGGGVKPLRVIQISDTHLLAAAGAVFNGVNTEETARAVLSAAVRETPDPDLVLVSGDLAEDGSPAAYRRLREHLRDAGVPVLVIPGNHDDPVAMAAVFDAPPVCWRESIRVGAWQVESLSSHTPDGPHGWLGEDRLTALESRLAGGTGPVLVQVHHPPVAVGSPWLDAMGLADGERLLRCLRDSQRRVVVVWGHVHQAFASYSGRIGLFGAPATCVQFMPGSERFALDARPPGWRWLTLYPDGRLDTGVGRLGEGEQRSGGHPAIGGQG
ncbi:phosphodiesterase [Arhodomonas sp. SL1]|uniref:phosphodiesterase n=1 Tax=Arhodomonas sp. SL1 TaxID=3425691 RepID=UPI003F88151B